MATNPLCSMSHLACHRVATQVLFYLFYLLMTLLIYIILVNLLIFAYDLKRLCVFFKTNEREFNIEENRL